ncbi:hypothetical protein HGRIS_004293 [Hohenbuehelia grisea]|uniref:MULE transposase domain-containing protein n=1 Tax=Hohenbuehelia grisea TaxID=104357 RepID=A0ABR3IPB7_9AGAR
MKHIPYYSVAMPPGALDMVRENLEWSTPSSIVAKIQMAYPNVTPKQIHSAWTVMSEALWKRDRDQMESARQLLAELGDEAEVFDVAIAEGVEQLCWGMKKIGTTLQGKVAEIGMDATFNTNAKNLELYSVLAEYDNTGFPLSYCLLSTAGAIDIGKRTKALEAWTSVLRDTYGVIPHFVHVDKDMAEIGMSRAVWPHAKIQICWWHLRRAVRSRLGNTKLSTTPYAPARAHAEFPFIDPEFRPTGAEDPQESEGDRLVDPEPVQPITVKPARPHALLLRVPANVVQAALNHGKGATEDMGMAKMKRKPEGMAATKPKVCLLMPMGCEPEGSTSTAAALPRVFCGPELRAQIIDMMEAHLCAHPLIPGYAHPSPCAIREWAVWMIYEYCVGNDLREVWAYLWENWYRRGRWELWARAPYAEIPILKTLMSDVSEYIYALSFLFFAPFQAVDVFYSLDAPEPKRARLSDSWIERKAPGEWQELAIAECEHGVRCRFIALESSLRL